MTSCSVNDHLAGSWTWPGHGHGGAWQVGQTSGEPNRYRIFYRPWRCLTACCVSDTYEFTPGRNALLDKVTYVHVLGDRAIEPVMRQAPRTRLANDPPK